MTRRLPVAAELFLIGAVLGLVGDAAHVQAGITEYLWDLPTIWKSAIWFPLLVGGGVTLGGWVGSRVGSPARRHSRREAYIAAAAILGIYCLTTVVADAPSIAADGICWAIALVVWLWWDDSPRAFGFGVIAMLVGPAVEILAVELGASRYLPAYDEIFGVAAWLLPLYFATGAVLSGIWRALER